MRFWILRRLHYRAFIQFHVASPAGTTLSSDRLGKHGVIHERGNITTRAQIYAHLKYKLILKYVIRLASRLDLRPRCLSLPLCVDDVWMRAEGRR